MSQPVLVTVEAIVQSAQRIRLLDAVPGLVLASRAEPGCIAYEVYVSVTEPNHIRTVERWASQAAADAHMAAPHTRAFLALAAQCLTSPPQFTTLPLG